MSWSKSATPVRKFDLPRSVDCDNRQLYALVVMPMAFVVSALMLTYIDQIAYENKAAGSN